MDDLQGTLGYSGRRGSKNLGELTRGDCPTFGALLAWGTLRPYFSILDGFRDYTFWS